MLLFFCGTIQSSSDPIFHEKVPILVGYYCIFLRNFPIFWAIEDILRSSASLRSDQPVLIYVRQLLSHDPKPDTAITFFLVEIQSWNFFLKQSTFVPKNFRVRNFCTQKFLTICQKFLQMTEISDENFPENFHFLARISWLYGSKTRLFFPRGLLYLIYRKKILGVCRNFCTFFFDFRQLFFLKIFAKKT